MKLQLLIPAKQTVTVTESFQDWHRHDYYAQEGTFLWSICEPFTVFLPSSKPLLLIKPVSPLPSPYGLLLPTSPSPIPSPSPSLAQVLSGLSLMA